MNVRIKAGLLATTVVGVIALAYAADPSPPQQLSEVNLPANSCSITCPAGTKWRGRPAAGTAGAGCIAGSSPVCQCQDDSRPIAGCEPVRKPQ